MPSLHTDITTRLAPISDTAALDASVLIARVINKPRTWVMAHPELTLTTEQQDQLDGSLERLEHGESFPYVIGRWEFFGMEFEVTPDVLIPRPETELLVEKAIVWLQESPSRKTVADIGTGSGAIAVSIAIHATGVNILATDISSKALQVAKRNAEKHGVSERIEFVECDLLPEKSSTLAPHAHLPRVQVPGSAGVVNRKHLRRTPVQVSSIDLLCANLPYIPTKTLSLLPIVSREPTIALDGGDDGLDLIRRLMNIAPAWLTPSGLILLEIEATQGLKALSLAREAFPQAYISLQQDLAGKDRLLKIDLSPQTDT